jgi:hypothetical protein
MTNMPITRTVTTETTESLTARWELPYPGLTVGRLKEIVKACEDAKLPDTLALWMSEGGGDGEIASIYIHSTRTLDKEEHR